MPTSPVTLSSCLLDEVFQGIYHGKKLHAPDLLEVLQRAAESGMDRLLLTASSQQDLVAALQMIPSLDQITMATTVGVHPCRVGELEADPACLERMAALAKESHNLIAAVGEIGLDYDRLEYASADLQRKWFERQMEFLLDAFPGKPLFLHMRAAIDDFADIIRKYRHRFEHGVAHSFTGSEEELKILLSLNLHIGLNGCSLRTAESLEVIKRIPLDRIMIESDAPWCEIRPTHPSHALLPTHLKPLLAVKAEKHQPGAWVKGRNEPYATRQVLAVLAAHLAMDEHQLAEQIYQNTTRVFK